MVEIVVFALHFIIHDTYDVCAKQAFSLKIVHIETANMASREWTRKKKHTLKDSVFKGFSVDFWYVIHVSQIANSEFKSTTNTLRCRASLKYGQIYKK